MFRLFRSRDAPECPSVWIIRDIQEFEMGKEYTEIGEAEGWLSYDGYQEINGVMHYYFRFLG